MSTNHEPQLARELLEELADKCTKAYEAGEPIDRSAMLEQLPPESRPVLREMLDGFALFDELAEGSTAEFVHRSERVRMSLDDPFANWPPKMMGEYEVGETIASPGGMGAVYETTAIDPLDGTRKRAVLKILSERPEVVRRVESKIREIRKVQHENLVRIYDCGRDSENNVFFYVMECIEGGDLAEHIEHGGLRAKPREVAAIIRMVALGMAAFHKSGRLHCDVKSRNILIKTTDTHIDKKDTVKLADFDLSRQLSAVDAPVGQENEPHRFAGSLDYASPEQVAGERQREYSDIYSTGVVLYETLTGRKLVGKYDSDWTKVAKISRDVPPPPSSINPDVPKVLDQICLKCLEKDPKRRYQNSADLADHLACFLRGESPFPPEGNVKRAAWWARRQSRLVAALGTLALLPVVLAVLLLKSNIDHEAELRAEAGINNTYIARTVAANMLFQSHQYSAVLVETAVNPAFHAAWLSKKESDLETFLRATFDRYNKEPRIALAQGQNAQTFTNLSVLNMDGRIVAIWPNVFGDKSRDFPGRDYFLGAITHAKEDTSIPIHVSRVFESRHDGLFKFALSVPFWAGARKPGSPDGVLVAILTTNSTHGLINLSDSNRTVALVLPFEGNPNPHERPKASDGTPKSYKILLHPAYQGYPGRRTVDFPRDNCREFPYRRPGPELWAPRPEQSLPANDAYFDPVANDSEISGAKDYQGRWIAGFAQVGNTEMMVVVQERYVHAIEKPRKWYWLSATYVVLVLFVAVLIVSWIARRVYRLTQRPMYAL